MTKASLRVADVSFGFAKGSKPLLQDINFECYGGTIYGLFGNNGSGKTTLFNLISGFLKASTGEIQYHGQSPPSHDPLTICSFREGLTRTFQVPVLVNELSVYENLLLAFRIPGENFVSLLHRRSKHKDYPSDIIDRVNSLIRDFGLESMRSASASTLSHGYRRIVSNLVALLSESQIVLLDEPFANVADAHIETLEHLLRTEALIRQKCILVIEHSPQRFLDGWVDTVFYLRGSLRTISFSIDLHRARQTLNGLLYGHE